MPRISRNNYRKMKNPASKIVGWQIIVVDNGFVFVGDCDPNHGDQLVVQHVKQLRKWGTENGLGQLVEGPTRLWMRFR